jgi:hypothetical protein
MTEDKSLAVRLYGEEVGLLEQNPGRKNALHLQPESGLVSVKRFCLKQMNRTSVTGC